MNPRSSKAGQAQATAFETKPLLAFIAAALLFGCSTFSGPDWLLAHSNYHGVEVRSAADSYQVASHFGIRAPQTADRSEWTFERLKASAKELHNGCFNKSCWTVAALPDIAFAAGYYRSDGCDYGAAGSPGCHGRNWRSALCRAKATSEYLLDSEPLPLDVEIYLIAENDAIEGSVIRESQTSVPLTFIFQFPAYDDDSEFSARRRGDALIHIMSKIWHEIQHVEYFGSAPDFKAAHKEVALIAENEARSVCWEYATEAVTAHWSGSALELTRNSHEELAAMRQVFGNIQRTNASAVVPMLVENRIIDYLTSIDGSALIGDTIRIDADDTRLLDHLVTFCGTYSPSFTGESNSPLIWTKGESTEVFDSMAVSSECVN